MSFVIHEKKTESTFCFLTLTLDTKCAMLTLNFSMLQRSFVKLDIHIFFVCQAHFARVRALATMAPTLGPNIAPHQFNFGHGVPALFPPPPPAGFGFQPNFVPNMMMPYNMQRQPGQRSGPPHGGMPRHLHNPHQVFLLAKSLSYFFSFLTQ